MSLSWCSESRPGKRARAPSSSPMMQPSDHMSTPEPYCWFCTSSSGARYQRVTTYLVSEPRPTPLPTPPDTSDLPVISSASTPLASDRQLLDSDTIGGEERPGRYSTESRLPHRPPPGNPMKRASPRSATASSQSRLSRMLVGFMSRWTTPARCMYRRARKAWTARWERR
eukprot:scaffold11882_cov122-Isochrysis_galbana.AAC.2